MVCSIILLESCNIFLPNRASVAGHKVCIEQNLHPIQGKITIQMGHMNL